MKSTKKTRTQTSKHSCVQNHTISTETIFVTCLRFWKASKNCSYLQFFRAKIGFRVFVFVNCSRCPEQSKVAFHLTYRVPNNAGIGKRGNVEIGLYLCLVGLNLAKNRILFRRMNMYVCVLCAWVIYWLKIKSFGRIEERIELNNEFADFTASELKHNISSGNEKQQ